MSIKLAGSPLSWINSDLPSLGKNFPLDSVLSEISEIGYEGFEFEAPFRNILDDLPIKMHAYGLECAGGWFSANLLENELYEELGRFDEHLHMLSCLNASVAVIAECSGAIQGDILKPLSKTPRVVDEEERELLANGLEVMALYAEKRGFKSAYHPHMGTVIQYEEDIDWLMEGSSKLGLLYDTGHLAFAEANLLRVLENHMDRITHVHCKNVRTSVLKRSLENDSSFLTAVLDGVFTVPGDDEIREDNPIDFEKVVTFLVEKGYQGWILMEAEQDPQKAEPSKYSRLGFERLQELLHFAQEKLSLQVVPLGKSE